MTRNGIFTPSGFSLAPNLHPQTPSMHSHRSSTGLFSSLQSPRTAQGTRTGIPGNLERDQTVPGSYFPWHCCLFRSLPFLSQCTALRGASFSALCTRPVEPVTSAPIPTAGGPQHPRPTQSAGHPRRPSAGAILETLWLGCCQEMTRDTVVTKPTAFL